MNATPNATRVPGGAHGANRGGEHCNTEPADAGAVQPAESNPAGIVD